MTVDWFTAGAQVVNFLILVYLLKRFLYRPVIEAMTRRQALIAGRMNDAQTMADRAQQKAAQYDERRQVLDARTEQLMAEAADRANAEQTRLMGVAHREIAETRARWRADLEREQSAMLTEIRDTLGKQIATTARKVLLDIADARLEKCAVFRFLRHLDELPPPEREHLTAALRSEGDLLVESAFVLSLSERSRLLEGLSLIDASERNVQFVESERLICGIALTVGGERWSWSIASYLGELETTLAAKWRSVA